MTERAPMILTFGELASRVAPLFRACPGLIPRLAFAPREAIHATAAFLCLSPEAEQPDPVVAERIAQSDPRDLLRAALPDCPRELYRALDQAGDRVHGKSYYQRIGLLCGSPFQNALLSADALDEVHIRFYEALQELDPLASAIHHALPKSRHTAEAVSCVAAFLRAHGAFDEGQFSLSAKAGPPAVLRRLLQAIDGVEAPDPGFTPPAPFRVVGTIGDLRHIGGRLQNCLRHPRQYQTSGWFALAAGTTVFLYDSDSPVLAALRRLAPGLWVLDQMAGPGNRAVTSEARDAVLVALMRSGVQIDGMDVPSALTHLAHCADTPREPGPNDPDIDEDDGVLAA